MAGTITFNLIKKTSELSSFFEFLQSMVSSPLWEFLLALPSPTKNNQNTDILFTKKMRSEWKRLPQTQFTGNFLLITCQCSWWHISGLPCLSRLLRLWRHHHQVRPGNMSKQIKQPLYQWPVDPDRRALCIRRLEHWSRPKCKTTSLGALRSVFTLRIHQNWKVVLGEFDDTKDDGWEQTFEVRLVFFWYFRIDYHPGVMMTFGVFFPIL